MVMSMATSKVDALVSLAAIAGLRNGVVVQNRCWDPRAVMATRCAIWGLRAWP